VLSGIYATWVHGLTERPWPSVSSFGTRPTVAGCRTAAGSAPVRLQRDLYGRRLQVEFVARLRDEEKFDDLETLTAQMQRDAARARQILSTERLRATA